MYRLVYYILSSNQYLAKPEYWLEYRMKYASVCCTT